MERSISDKYGVSTREDVYAPAGADAERQRVERGMRDDKNFPDIRRAIREIQEPQDGCWIALTNPTATEIFEISERFQIEVDDLRAPLDEEERSRIEVEDTYTLILVDVPMIEERNEKDLVRNDPSGYHCDGQNDLYDLSGRYSGAYKVHGKDGSATFLLI